MVPYSDSPGWVIGDHSGKNEKEGTPLKVFKTFPEQFPLENPVQFGLTLERPLFPFFRTNAKSDSGIALSNRAVKSPGNEIVSIPSKSFGPITLSRLLSHCYFPCLNFGYKRENSQILKRCYHLFLVFQRIPGQIRHRRKCRPINLINSYPQNLSKHWPLYFHRSIDWMAGMFFVTSNDISQGVVCCELVLGLLPPSTKIQLNERNEIPK